MRMRSKPWAQEELAHCPFYTDQPEQYRGVWQNRFRAKQPLHLELGCGKGGFIAQIAPNNPNINYIAVDIKDAVLGLAIRKTAQAYAEKQQSVDNIIICACDIERIEQMLSPQDTVSRIYINFCNPWPKARHHKKRLTHEKQLRHYLTFMPKGEIFFKTDDLPLFYATHRYLQNCGFSICYQTQDLHNSGYQPNYATEHEIMYSKEGIPICFLIASI